MEKWYPQYKPQKHWEKRKDQGNIIITIITIINMIMTMTEILGSETEIDHIAETDHRITTAEIDHTVEIDWGMTIEMTIEMTTEMTVEKKIIGISKTRNIIESIEIIKKTHMKTDTTKIVIGIVTRTKIEIKTKTNTEMTAITKLEIGLRKNVAHMMMIVLKQNLKECTKFYSWWVKKKKWQ